jgi:hypothetical protein
MSSENLAILLQMYSTLSSNEANLWMMYVAACLACAGFGVTTNTLTSMPMGVIACLGFLAFAVGQFVMVNEIVLAREIVVAQLKPAIGAGHQLSGFVTQISPLGLTRSGALLTHAVVDLCIVALILFRPAAKMKVFSRRRKG